MARARRELPSLPEEVRAERGAVLRRTLRAFPDDSLTALVRGLDRAGDKLVAGRLFRGGDGGCAVGVMLRELDPARYPAGGPRFWVLHSWRRRVRWYRGLARRHPRLQHLEWTFDRASEAGRERGLSRGQAAAAVGAWVRREAEAELGWRRLTRTAAAESHAMAA